MKPDDFAIDALDGKADDLLVAYVNKLGKIDKKYIVFNDDETISTNLQELIEIVQPFDPYVLVKLHTQ